MRVSKKIKKHRRRRTLKRVRYVGGNNNCLFVSLTEGEGLGNQLYIYAAALVVQKKINIPICMTESKNNPHSKTDYRVLFNVNRTDMNDKDILNRINNAPECLLSKGDRDLFTTNDIKYLNGDTKMPNKVYQNYGLIRDVINDVKKSLIHNEFNKDKYTVYKNMIKDSKSTAFVHIRRGDKIARGWAVGENYYSNGIAELNKNSEIKTIYIFSNDIDWAKSKDSLWKEHTDKPIIYYNNQDDLVILYLMMLCEGGAVEGNSTYSAWGAMLGADSNDKSTIVYKRNPPEYPYIENPFNFPNKWIGII